MLWSEVKILPMFFQEVIDNYSSKCLVTRVDLCIDFAKQSLLSEWKNQSIRPT